MKRCQEAHGHTAAFFRRGASRTIRNAATAKRLPTKPRIIHRDLFIPSLTALRYSHAAVSSQHHSQYHHQLISLGIVLPHYSFVHMNTSIKHKNGFLYLG